MASHDGTVWDETGPWAGVCGICMASFRVWLDSAGDGIDVEYGEESI
jgi:hypothetical protein